jgi:hypothetical protein
MMRLLGGYRPPHFQGGPSWSKPNSQFQETCHLSALSLTRWARSSEWVTAGDRGTDIGQFGSISSSFPDETNWVMSFLKIWRPVF